MSVLSGRSRWGLRSIALLYLSALLIVPVAMIFYRTFEHGLSQPLDAITSSDGLHAFWLTIVCVGIGIPRRGKGVGPWSLRGSRVHGRGGWRFGRVSRSGGWSAGR